jgi:hypothetical protein
LLFQVKIEKTKCSASDGKLPFLGNHLNILLENAMKNSKEKQPAHEVIIRQLERYFDDLKEESRASKHGTAYRAFNGMFGGLNFYITALLYVLEEMIIPPEAKQFIIASLKGFIKPNEIYLSDGNWKSLEALIDELENQ